MILEWPNNILANKKFYLKVKTKKKKIQYEQSGQTIELQKPRDTLALKHLLKVLHVNPFLFFFYF